MTGMRAANRFQMLKTGSLWFALVLPVFSAEPALVVDRGLPRGNVNDGAGAYRSNIRWSAYDSGFLGDDFAVGAPGEHWIIDKIRVWTVPGAVEIDPSHLGDFYKDVRLYFGGPEDGVTPVVTGLLTPSSNDTSDPRILISDAAADGVAPYEGIGAYLRIWQIDFTDLKLPVQGGVKYRFAAWGLGRPKPDSEGKTYPWFNLASNPQFAATTQDGADEAMLLFASGGKFMAPFSGKGAGWDKGADINVQVFAHRSSPATRR